jgi:integrase/recombinase XerD
MNDNTRLLFDFTEHLKVLNRSPATIKAYTGHVSHYLADQGKTKTKDIKAVTRTDMERYVAAFYDRDKKYSTGTICVKIRSLKRFFEYLEQSNIIFINPMEYILEPKKDKTIPRNILTGKEMAHLLDQPNLGTRTGIRDRTVLEVFYSTGIRLAELCNLSIYDADLQGKMLRINQGKGRKDRVVPLGKHAIRFLREYISKVRPHLTRKNRRSRTLFVNQLSQPLSKQVVSLMVRTSAQKAKLTKKVSAHILRHTFASMLVKNGADVVAVQKMLGHRDLKTTQGYIKGFSVDLKKAHKKSHPREKDKISRESIKPKIKRMRPEYASRQS